MNQSRALDPVGSTRPDAPSEPGTREAEILAAIRRAFAAKGFDGASMQYLAREAGMSVGNFYRYFPSKAAMVEAMILATNDGESLHVSVSIGVSQLRPEDDDGSLDQVLERADEALYRAKANGRNRVELSADEAPKPPAR